MIFTLNAFPFGNFGWAFIKVENVHNVGLSKQNNFGKEIPVTSEPGILLCPPNYIKNSNAKDLLNTADSKLTIQVQHLRI